MSLSPAVSLAEPHDGPLGRQGHGSQITSVTPVDSSAPVQGAAVSPTARAPPARPRLSTILVMARREYTDPAWREFPIALREMMKGPPFVSIRRLADALGVQESVVTSWRKGRGRPDLGMIPVISARVSELQGEPDPSPLTLFRLMGVLDPEPDPAELSSASYRLQKLELKLGEAESRFRAFSRRAGVAAVTSAAASSSEWAVAVWPAIEGPAGCRMHVADRIDIARTDHAPATTAEVWNVPEMRMALRSAFATPSSTQPRWIDPNDIDQVSTWTIRHVGSPFGPLVTSPWPGLPTVSVYALTIDSWVYPFSAMLAMMLGYGLTATPDLALEESGQSGELAAGVRARIATHLSLKHPLRRVWAHHGRIDDWSAILGSPGGSPLHIYLRESRQALRSRESDERFPELGATRARLDALLSERTDVLVVPVEPCASRDDRWFQALVGVESALRYVDASQRGPQPGAMWNAVRANLTRDEQVGARILKWMDTRSAEAGLVHLFSP